MKDDPNYITKCFITFSQCLNTIAFLGWPDEMLSARSYRMRHKKSWYMIECTIDFVFLVVLKQKNHCEECYHWEKRRYDVPVDYSSKPKRQKYVGKRFSNDG